MITDNVDCLLNLKLAFETTSVNQLNFLDVHVDATQPNVQCLVYQKPTNSGIYLNYNSECPS